MSSTTDERRESGQALVILALALGALLLVGALAFDAGMAMLERRDEQNAADAAALAGARCLPDVACARSRAVLAATANGYTSGSNSTTVSVGVSSTRVQVMITRSLPSMFAVLANIANWDASAFALAIKQSDQPPFAALMALDPHACPAIKVTGTGLVSTWGDVQVNSDCESQALQISGQGNLRLEQNGLACWVVGGYQISGKGEGELCDPPEPGVPTPFPVNGSPENTTWPAPPVQEGGTLTAIPNGCPGSTVPATDAAPATCQFQASYKDTTWRLYPGYYPGGIKLQGGTFYLEPGIYHLAGGGFTVTSTDTSVTSVDPGGTVLGGGQLFYNTTHSGFANGPIQVGGNGAIFNLWPLGGFDPGCSGPSLGWERYLMFQDPAVTNELVINGGSNDVSARGLILAPTANVKVNGGSGTLTMDAIIANTFVINGNAGNINVLYDSCALPTFSGYGLVI